MREYFLKKRWYIPLYDNVDGLLSKTETENIELIKRYEKYLGSYNESYAR
ncbi:MAG: YARHG domain-containing protein [Ignavibacteria bacterium]|nr:YARHG domain-containing protein [Ignavibacteria bacterium]MBK8383780.1 YARHG domain-containing protein [Ignavibacteria bacterium]